MRHDTPSSAHCTSAALICPASQRGRVSAHVDTDKRISDQSVVAERVCRVRFSLAAECRGTPHVPPPT
eukprot:342420-Prymnesium_polylepis.1